MARKPVQKHITNIHKFMVFDYGTSYWVEIRYFDITLVKEKETERDVHEVAFKVSKSKGGITSIDFDDEPKKVAELRELIPPKILELVKTVTDSFSF